MPDDIAYWQKQLYRHNDYIESLARKRFHQLITAEEAHSYVMEKLEADNYRRIRTYNGRNASFTTFLTTVVNRLLIDFRKKKYGDTSKPPKWIAQFGGRYISIFEMICREKCSVAEAIDMICDENRQACYTDRSLKRACESDVERIATEIIMKIRGCGMTAKASEVNIESVPEPALPTDTEDEFILSEKEAIMKAIFDVVLNCETSQASPAMADLVDQFRSRLDLSSEDRIFLKTVYVHGYNVSKAARALGLEGKKPHQRHHRLLTMIRDAFEATGMENMIRSLVVEA